MTKPRKSKRGTSPKRTDGPPLPPGLTMAIEQAWPDGKVEMAFDSEESWFREVQEGLQEALLNLGGARVRRELASEETPRWTDSEDDDDYAEDLSGDANRRSYHLYFLVPGGDAFTFETECETMAEPDWDDYAGEDDLDKEEEIITVQGRGHRGLSVAVSLIAPFAAIAPSDYVVFEDGSISEPAIERHIEDEHGNHVDLEEHFRKACGPEAFQALEKLRTRIVGILEKYGITVLTEADWRKPVPGLRHDASAFVGDAAGGLLRVLDAFFFEGL